MNDRPPIDDLDDIISVHELGAIFNLKPAAIRNYMRGHKGKPPLPYVRFSLAPYFSKRQVAWWLRQIQEQPDPMQARLRRAHRELGDSQ